jgi:mono/diheme cytochrome c family protein
MRGLIRSGLIISVIGVGFVFSVAKLPIGEDEALGQLEGDAYRGAYLARSSGCIACHTNNEAATPALAGGAPLVTPFGTFVPPNITADPFAGIGDWTMDQFAMALRQGINPEGKAYYPAFPYEFYAGFSDQDIADLWVALRTVPSVSIAAAPHDVGFPFNQRWGLKLWRAAYMRPVEELSPIMGKSDAWNRGQELVNGAAHCAACHTGRNMFGGLKPSERFTGNDTLPGGSSAPSILSSDLATAGWSEAAVAYALRTGLMPNGDVMGGSMAEVVRDGTSYLDEADRQAIAAYLMDGAVPVAQQPANGSMQGMTHEPGMVMN